MNDRTPEQDLLPLVHVQVDLRDFVFMPLDVLRLRDSDLATLATGDEFKAAVLLWCAAWHQIPAGSVPNDDRWLARHSGAGALWKKVKAEALRGFVECSDGRLYHSVVASKAMESWTKKQEQRTKTLKARIAALEKRIKDAATEEEKQYLQSLSQSLSQTLLQSLSQGQSQTLSQPPSKGTVKVRDSKGTVKGIDIKPPAAAITRPDDVPENVWNDFQALRKAKKAPISETALQGIRSESDKAGVTLEAALRMCCERGWQGFKAEWLTEKQPTKVNGNGHGKFNVIQASRKALERELAKQGMGSGTAQEVFPALPE